MYENGGKRKIRIDLPSVNMPEIKDKGKFKIVFSILSKFLIICIFFFVLTLCYTKIDKLSKKQYDEDNFNPNLSYVNSTMINYYQKNNDLKIVGDSTSFSLEELINKKIISIDKLNNIETCDLKNSFSSFTKIKEKKYTIITTIICDGIEENLEKTIKL